MRYRIEREGRTHFDSPVREHHVQLRLAPWDCSRQRLLAFRLAVEPAAEAAVHRDGFGNLVHRFSIMDAHDYLLTRLGAEVETRPLRPADVGGVAPERELEWIRHSLREAPRLWEFVVHRSPFTPELPQEIAGKRIPVYTTAAPLAELVRDTMAWIRDLCVLDPDREDPEPKLSSVLAKRQGSRADLVHLLIAIVRGWGVPARFAIGYVDPSRYPSGGEAGAGRGEPRPEAMQSWAEILVPGANWRIFDPASELPADENYIRVAVGRDARDAPPERSAYAGESRNAETLVALTVTRQR